MPNHNNQIIIAAAGSGKTTDLLELALSKPESRVLITTYTTENLSEISERITSKHSVTPKNINVVSWFSFLFAHGVRPCTSHMAGNGIDKRINGVQPTSERSARGIAKTRKHYWVTKDNRIYTDKLSDFACLANQLSSGLIIERLEHHFDYIFIDEVQDFSGYDLDFLELLLSSNINIICVGDPRQVVYQTSPSAQNSQYRSGNVINKFKEWEKNGLCEITYKNNSKRCSPIICQISDTLFPEYPETTSENTTGTNHDGVFLVREDQVQRYLEDHNNIMILKNDNTTDTQGYPSLNFGKSKGRTYDRVLVFCNGPLSNFLNHGSDTELANQTRSRIYVAITRARQSVAFVTNEPCCYDYVQRAYDDGWQETLF